MSIPLILSETQYSLLLSCFNDFRSLCGMASEFIKLEPLYAKIVKHSEFTTIEIEFINGILETVIRNYRNHLIICETNPGRFPEEVRTHYVEKVTAIINLKNLL